MPDATEEITDIKSEELREEIEKILKGADLSSITSKVVRQKLEKKYGRSLVKQKVAIDDIVLSLVNAMSSEEEGDDGENSDGYDSAAENKKTEETRRPRRKAAPRPARAKRSRKADSDDEEDKPKKKGAKGGRGKGSGYTRPCKLSPALAELMGQESMPRHEVVKQMWALIKEKKLHDPKNRQFAICDEALYNVIGTKRFRIFGMMKYLKSHFLDD
ncbi:hypothetical protein ACJJTC_005223 [Scirpophaga incertulas]